MSPTQQDMVRYRVLQALQNNPSASQRELAKELGVSLGSINFCIKALVEKGLVKVDNFTRSDNKRGYVYFLTPKGVAQKGEITLQFLNRKKEEYELLKREINELTKEAKKYKEQA